MTEIKRISESGVTFNKFEKQFNLYINEGKIFHHQGNKYNILRVFDIEQEKDFISAMVEVQQVK